MENWIKQRENERLAAIIVRKMVELYRMKDGMDRDRFLTKMAELDRILSYRVSKINRFGGDTTVEKIIIKYSK